MSDITIKLTPRESQAINALHKLAKSWPPSLIIHGQSGTLQVIKDVAFIVADTFAGIYCDGGDTDLYKAVTVVHPVTKRDLRIAKTLQAYMACHNIPMSESGYKDVCAIANQALRKDRIGLSTIKSAINCRGNCSARTERILIGAGILPNLKTQPKAKSK